VAKRKEKRQPHEPDPLETGAQNSSAEQRTGELTAESGIHQVLGHPHFSEKELFLRRDSILPACPICGEPVTFRMVQAIAHIAEDPDFQ
jgi:hypothetical protein